MCPRSPTATRRLPARASPLIRPCSASALVIAGASNGSVNSALASGAQTSDMQARSEEHTSELQSLMRISYAVFCLKKKKNKQHNLDKYTTTSTTTGRNN